jgi:hypothetical protein
MAILDPISTPMQERTMKAVDSPNPFMTPTPPPRRLDGKPVAPVVPIVANVPEPTPEPEPVQEVVQPEPEKPKRGRKAKQALEEVEAPIVQNPIIESRTKEGLPSYRCEFAGRDIFVGWPFYRSTNPVTAATQLAFALDFGRDKIRFDMCIGDAIIGHSRNRLAHKFLETDAKWFLMIDDDIIPSIGRPAWFRYWVQGARTLPDLPLQRHGIHRLIGAGKTLVGGAYFGRQEGGALMCSDNSLYSRAKSYEDAVVPVDWVGTGFMLIHRKVFDDIKQKYGNELKISVPDYEIDYFRQIDGSKGEDVSFCLRAKNAGHQPYIDLGLPIFHVGAKTY